MTNEQIIEGIKQGETDSVANLAVKYGISDDNARIIAESIIRHNAYSIQKRSNKVVHCDEILIGWRGRGYLGAFDTHTVFVLHSDEYGNETMSVYGD